MKKYKIQLNILFGLILVLSIISFSLMIKLCNNCYTNYNLLKDFSPAGASDALSLFLQTLFAVLFSALSAIASAIAAVIFNLRVAKQK